MVNINGQTKPLGPEQHEQWSARGEIMLTSAEQIRLAKTQGRVHTTTQNDVWAAHSQHKCWSCTSCHRYC
jgi:hypothetical protein